LKFDPLFQARAVNFTGGISVFFNFLSPFTLSLSKGELKKRQRFDRLTVSGVRQMKIANIPH
jgi:hypothetical protein